MPLPRDVIADIRRRYRLDVPVNDDDPYREMAGGLLPLVTDELYESRTHFFTELLQNADDNAYAEGVVPTLELIARPESLELLNNETGFEAKHVRALCNAAKSTKRDRKDGATGEKGIGFKAVFQVSDRPEVHSNGYHFRFDKNQHGPFGTVIPEWVECPAEKTGTRIVLPLRDDYRLPFDFLKSLQPELLLFLRRLKRIAFRNVDFGQSVVLRRNDDGATVEVVRTVVDDVEKQRSGEQRHRFRIHQKRVSMADIIEPRRLNIAATEVAVALALDDDGNIDEGRSRDLFAFLPVKDSGFRFLAHGDFVLATSREAVREDVPWNVRLRDSLGLCLAEAVLACRSSSVPGATALRVLTDPKSVADLFLRDILARAINELSEHECVPTIGGGWVRPNAAILTDSAGLWQLVPENDAATLLGKQYVTPDVDRIDQALARLGVGRFGLETLLTCLGNDTWRNARRPSWFGSLYGRLGEVRLDDRQIEALKRARLLRLENGDTTAPTSGAVFRSLGTDVRYGFEAELDLLAPEVLSSIREDDQEAAYKLLERLGVSDATAIGVIDRHILKLHGGPEWSACSDDMLLGHAHYVRDHLTAYLNGKASDKRDAAKADLAAKLKVRRSIDIKSSRYTSAASLFLGTVFRDPDDIEGLFGKLISDSCVSSQYLSRGHPDGAEAASTAWRDFFVNLGAHTLPRVFYSGDRRDDYEWAPEVAAVITSNDESIKVRLLALIDKHWDTRYGLWKDRTTPGRPGPSKLTLALRAMQVPTTNGAAPLSHGYVASDENRAVFGGAVPYLTMALSTSFAAALGVTVAPTIDHAIARLDEIRSQNPNTTLAKSLVGPLYRFLEQRFDQHGDAISAAFRARPIVLGEGTEGGSWATTGNCCWSLPRELRPFTQLVGLSTSWRDFQGFFCERLGVQDGPSGDNLVDALTSLSQATLPPDQMTRVARTIYGRLRLVAGEIDGEDTAGAVAWLRRMRGDPLLWTKSNEWWRNEDDVLAADDPTVESLFAGAKSLAFIHLPPEDLTSHGKLLHLLRIPKLSETLVVSVPGDVSSDVWPEFKVRLRDRLRAMARFLHHKYPDVLDAAVQSGAFRSLANLDAHRCTPLELEVGLKKDRARHAFEARMIDEGGRPCLYVDASTGRNWDPVGIEIGRLLGLSDTESLSIGKLLEKETLADVEKFLETLRVAELPVELSKILFDEGYTEAPVSPDEDSTQGEQAGTTNGAVASDQTGASAETTDSPSHAAAQGQASGASSGGATGSGDGIASVGTGGSGLPAGGDVKGPPGDTSSQGSGPSSAGEKDSEEETDGRIDSTEIQEQQEEDLEGDASSDENGQSDDSAIDDEGADGNAGGAGGKRTGRDGRRAGRNGSRRSQEGGSGEPPTKPDAAGRDRRGTTRSGSVNERMRSYVQSDADSDEGENDGMAAAERANIGDAAIRHVLEWERREKRDPTNENVANPQNEGYDISSKGLNDKIERCIEVKGVKGEWGSRGVAVTPAQFNCATEQGQLAWLYIVEFALSESPRIHRIQDYARRVWRFGFDDGWRKVAEAANKASVPEPAARMRVRLTDGRTGVVVRVFGAGNNQGVEVALDTGGAAIRIPWQPARIAPIGDSEKC